MRDNGKIYHSKPHDESLVMKDQTVLTRPKKAAEERAELKEKIARCSFFIRCAGPGISQEYIEKSKADMAKYERRLAALGEHQHRIKKSYKKIPIEKIRAYTIAWIEDAKRHGDRWVKAEDIAYQLSVRPHFVKQVLQQLNIDGLVYQPIHSAPHDSPRSYFGYGDRNAWTSDVYYIRESDTDEEDD